MSFHTSLYSTLAADSGISAIVSNRIYPQVVPENVVFPCIVYEYASVDYDYTHDGRSTNFADRMITFKLIAEYVPDGWSKIISMYDALVAYTDASVGTFGDTKVAYTQILSQYSDFDIDYGVVAMSVDVVFHENN